MGEPEVEAPPVRSDGLQLDEHRSFQERLWSVERGAWVGFGAVVVAALLGVTGSGGYFSRTAVSLDGARIEYPRFTRWEAADSFKISFEAGEAERSLTLSPAFAEIFQIEDVQPEPVAMQARPDGERLVFSLVADAPAVVHIHVRAQRPGLANFNATVDGGARRNITSIVLP